MAPWCRSPDANGCCSRCSSCTSRRPHRWWTPRSRATARRRNSPCACSPSPDGERCSRARKSAVSANPIQERGLLPKNRVVAVFDLDGTLTFSDSLLPFLRFVAGDRAFFLRLPLVAAILAAMALRLVSRQRAKELVLRMFLRGRSRAELERQGERFARDRLPAMLRPQASARLRWHQSRGHHSVVATASLALYVAPWAAGAGFDDVLATELEYDAHGCATGRILGENCRGEEKLRRLGERFGELSGLTLHGYGDSAADRAFLAYCTEAHYRPFREIAAPAAAREEARVNRLGDFLRLMRPHQWVKNAFVFVGIIFGHAWTTWPLVLAACGAAAAFCLTSSAVYIVNDYADRERDRVHPKKRHRPLASGRVTPRAALCLAAALASCGLALAYAAGPLVAAIVVGYAAMNLAYSFALKNVVILDVFVIA